MEVKHKKRLVPFGAKISQYITTRLRVEWDTVIEAT